MPGIMPIEMILLQLVFLAVPVATVGFFGWLALRYVRSREREAEVRRIEPSDHVEGLRESVETLKAEVRLLRERQEFIEKLLERPRSMDR
jgi:cell division protein FtsB